MGGIAVVPVRKGSVVLDTVSNLEKRQNAGSSDSASKPVNHKVPGCFAADGNAGETSAKKGNK